MGRSFRDSASFGKRMEYKIIGDMLMEGLDCYVPLVDDHGVDLVIKKQDGTFIEVQIKARGTDVKEGDAALFAAIEHEERPNYYFVFVSERMKKMWIMTSAEFIEHSNQNKNGKNTGKRSIWFNGYRTNKANGEKEEYPRDKFKKFEADNYDIFK